MSEIANLPAKHGSAAPSIREAMMPQSFADVLRFADMVSKTQFVPQSFRGKPEEVIAAITYGAELGLSPMQALRGIAVINGTPACYGDALLAVCQSHPQWRGKEEWIEGEGNDRTAHCIVRRKGEPDVHATFSVADARRAGLWEKAGPWKQYPDRMLMFRARGFGLRDQFADALRGVVTVEEAQDYPQQAIGPHKARDVTPRPATTNAAPAEDWIFVYDADGAEESVTADALPGWIAAQLERCDTAEKVATLRDANPDTPEITDACEEAMARFPLLTVRDQKGAEHSKCPNYGEALRKYGELKGVPGADPRALAIANIDLLRGAAADESVSAKWKKALLAEIEAAEAVMEPAE